MEEKIKKSKVRFIIYVFFVLEILFWLWVYNSMCMCGHRDFKIIPVTAICLTHVISYIVINKKYVNKLQNRNFILLLFMMYFVTLIGVAILSKNDMAALHSIDVV